MVEKKKPSQDDAAGADEAEGPEATTPVTRPDISENSPADDGVEGRADDTVSGDAGPVGTADAAGTEPEGAAPGTTGPYRLGAEDAIEPEPRDGIDPSAQDRAAGAEDDTLFEAESATAAPDDRPDRDAEADFATIHDAAGHEADHEDAAPAGPIGVEETGDPLEDPRDEAARDQGAADAAPPPAPMAEPVVIRKGGFLPMVLGGLVAGALGFAVALFTLPQADPPDTAALDALRGDVEAQGDALAALTEALSEQETVGEVDLSGVEATQSEAAAAISALADRMDTLETAMAELEASGDATAGAAQESPEVDALRAEVEELRGAVRSMESNTAEIEKEARAAAETTLERAILTRIQTALDTGAGFEPALVELQDFDVTVPETLSAVAESGVATLTELQEAFAEGARNALSAARAGGARAEGGGFSEFLKVQLGARSLEPREGSDPDAVLSRAEAAVQDDRLRDAMAEIEALPDAARAELASWVDRATERLAALAAAQDLGDGLN